MKIAPNKKIILLIGFIGSNIVFAAPNPPPPAPPPPPGTPIDGWVTAFIILSIFYGLYKIKQIKKASN